MDPSGVTAQARIIGRYALYGEIAAGGMATVHFGRLVGPVGFSRTVAIKRLHPQFAKDPEFVSMFLDEARLAARIQHPNVVATLDVVPLDGEVFLVMEYVQGESLSRLLRGIRRGGGLVPPGVAITIMANALHGLHAAHEAKSERGEPLNIVHRDISPQNILVGTDGTSRVLDFGVAKAAMRAQSTRDGQMKGKVSYMAPEQLRGRGVDRRTDIFAAGIVLWETLTAQRLFDGNDPGEILAKLLESRIMPPSQMVPGLSPALDAIVLRALDRNQDNRFRTAREFAIALEKCGPMTLPREVGEWVEDVGGEALSKRAEQVAEIESISSIGAEANVWVNADPRMGTLPPNSHPMPMPSAPPVSSDPMRASWPGRAPVVVTEGTSPSQVTSLSVASSPSLPHPRRRQGIYAALVGVAAALGIALVVLVVTLLKRSQAQDDAVVAAPAPEAPAVSAAPPLTELTPEPTPAPTVEVSAEPALSASAPEPEKTTPAPQKPVVAVRPKPKPAATKKPEATPPPQDNCTPPYTIDAKGFKRPKPGCY